MQISSFKIQIIQEAGSFNEFYSLSVPVFALIIE